MSEKKKYLHCFNCGDEIFVKGEDFSRIPYINKNGKKRTKPVCFECQASWAQADAQAWEEEQWYKKNPGKSMEEEMTKQFYLNKYGEY